MNSSMYCHILKQSMIPFLRRLGCRAVLQHDNEPKHTSKTTTALLKKLRIKVICGAPSNGRWRSARSLHYTHSKITALLFNFGNTAILMPHLFTDNLHTVKCMCIYMSLSVKSMPKSQNLIMRKQASIFELYH